MKIEIEFSKDVDYPVEEECHITGFGDSIGECFEEIIRYRTINFGLTK